MLSCGNHVSLEAAAIGSADTWRPKVAQTLNGIAATSRYTSKSAM
jgi:hypothetical protein